MAGQPGKDSPEAQSGGEHTTSRTDDEVADPVPVDGPAAAWIRERAEALDLSPREYLERVIGSLRGVETGESPEDQPTAEEFSSLEDRIEALDEEMKSKVQDVRDRVIQVKREVDGKAAESHAHDDLREGIETGLKGIEQAEQQISSLEETIEEMESRLERGFENYEEILQYLVDRTDDLSGDASSLLDAMSGLKQQVRRLQVHEERRGQTDALKEEANRKGVTEARCETCDNDVEIALLTEPSCPFCETAISGVTPKQGFFGSATLVSGSPPALEEGPSADDDDLADLQSEATGQAATGAGPGRDPSEILDEDGSLVDVEPTDTDAVEQFEWDTDE